ncbi:DUF2059 domain-containing protein [Vibrio tritonius]|uniref:DUF2059 domain-containing protein n=1 Tax=Vibrio tritonius TaxID=1435069 RepID=A0ABS7YSG0_9VIBR|nr:DUF2059 domain-containing protein [Vibrio tritonius]MCA2017169.1 DUF2059 domain-containing protein [Vibrio tritonius]
MNIVLSVITILISILFSEVSVAENEREHYAREYVNIMKFNEYFDEYLKQCRASMENMTPEMMVESNPNYFYGIMPGSYYWPEAVQIFKSYYKEACNYMSTSEFLDIYVSEYSKSLSVNELKAAIEFYQTDTGKKLRDTSVSANAAFQLAANKMQAINLQKVTETFTKRLEELGIRYRVNPK